MSYIPITNILLPLALTWMLNDLGQLTLSGCISLTYRTVILLLFEYFNMHFYISEPFV